MPLKTIDKYFRVVKLVKVGILVVVGIIASTIVGFIIKGYFFSHHEGDKKPRKVLISQIVQNVAEGTRIYGQDKNKQPFDIQAQEVVQKTDNKIEVLNINANHLTKDAKKISASSGSATVDQSTNSVVMDGNVKIVFDNQYHLSAQKAAIDYNNAIIDGNTKVILETKFGRIESDKFEVKDDYNLIKFYGNRVKTTLYPKGQNE